MNEITTSPITRYGRGFIPEEFLPEGKDEYYIRNEQCGFPQSHWRQLDDDEREILVKNGNTCENWDLFYITDPFHPRLIKNCTFVGMVRIGKTEKITLEHHGLRLPVGITQSTIISSDIGDNCALHNVRYCAHYCIGNSVILFNIDEMLTTNNAKFGNGIIKHGETDKDRICLALMNENGNRTVLPFDRMIPADAYIWLKYPHNSLLQTRLKEITQKQYDSRRGWYGTVGDYSVIKQCRIIKDVKIGPSAYIKGVNKLKNLTINSSKDEPTRIGEGVELVNGIVGYGCKVFYGSKAVRFVMGRNSNLQYGARLFHSYLGDNSTISCCEALHNLIFPAHQQHHNNSFLIATLIMGQSNIAAGACVGSNHNSRANDGEIRAGRGFWPGLSVTLKHSSAFASYILLEKGNYPGELNIPLPFSLVTNNINNNSLEIVPAFWWLYNMYALIRNSRKFEARDTRKNKVQHIEYDFLAPDTVEEIFHGMQLLEIRTAKAYLRAAGRMEGPGMSKSNPGTGDRGISESDRGLSGLGREILNEPGEKSGGLEILGENMEKSHRRIVIKKAGQGYQGYKQMIHYYGMKHLISFLTDHPGHTLKTMQRLLDGKRETRWVNIGGQIAREKDILELCEKITQKKLNTWDEIHHAYDTLQASYTMDKQRHAYASLLTLLETDRLTPDLWKEQLSKTQKTAEYIRDQVFATRKKDYDNPFRQATFDSKEEMMAVITKPAENDFIQKVNEETEAFLHLIETMKKR